MATAGGEAGLGCAADRRAKTRAAARAVKLSPSTHRRGVERATATEPRHAPGSIRSPGALDVAGASALARGQAMSQDRHGTLFEIMKRQELRDPSVHLCRSTVPPCRYERAKSRGAGGIGAANVTVMARGIWSQKIRSAR